jgi:dual specificity protein kinase YAK1
MGPIATRPHAPQLPPIQSNMSPESFYPQSATQQLNAVYNREARSPRTSTNPNPPQLPPIGRGSVPKFEKCTNTAELQPKINSQPPFRRANPEGGFISVCRRRIGAMIKMLTAGSLFKRSPHTCP